MLTRLLSQPIRWAWWYVLSYAGGHRLEDGVRPVLGKKLPKKYKAKRARGMAYMVVCPSSNCEPQTPVPPRKKGKTNS
jgi:hypothetical protein